jgi:cystathionine gamma-synthase
MKEVEQETWLVSAGRPHEPGSPLNVPLVAASNFLLGGNQSYARDEGTANWRALEEIVGGLEGGESVAFASGMAAAAAVFDQLPPRASVVIPDDCYHGVVDLAESGAEKERWQLKRLAMDQTQLWVEAAANADLIWLESPTNPLLIVADLKTICAVPRKPSAILAVDNTFATPLLQQPLALGADVSMQSATKYIGGHSDLLSGILTSTKPALLEGFRNSRKQSGAIPGALESFLAVRGLRTLAIRLQKSQENAGKLAAFLEQHAGVDRVRYPGLASHPTHAIATQQLKGFGGMISFEVSGDWEAADAVCKRTRLIRHATSLGGVESTMERRGAIPGQDQVPPNLLRLSVGIEAYQDLQADLDQALSACK